MKDKILQLAVECGFDMSPMQRVYRLKNELIELKNEIDDIKAANYKETWKLDLSNEIADVYITSILLCSALGIDFDTIVADKIEEVRSRYGRD